jgi:hypothetical protein
MRTLLIIRCPVEEFNGLLRKGTATEKINNILETTRPEAAYFTELNGQRTAILVADLPDPSKIPNLVEPWFLNFNAQVEIHVAMTPEDLRRADLTNLSKKWA